MNGGERWKYRLNSGGHGNTSLLSLTDRAVCSSLEPVQTQPRNMLPSCMVALVLSNGRIFKIKSSSFSDLDLLKRPLWSLLPRAMLKPEVHWMPMVWGAHGDHVDV